jgi:hypothetical protein
MSLEGFNATFGVYWTRQAYHEQFISPELKPIPETFVELAKTDKNAKEILTKLKEQFEYVILVHASLVDLLKAECLAEPIDLKAKGVLDLIHTEEGLPEYVEYWCKRQREKL